MSFRCKQLKKRHERYGLELFLLRKQILNLRDNARAQGQGQRRSSPTARLLGVLGARQSGLRPPLPHFLGFLGARRQGQARTRAQGQLRIPHFLGF